MEITQKCKAYIGLAMRAGRVKFGVDAITEGKGHGPILMDEALSDNAKSKLTHHATTSQSPLFTVTGLPQAVSKDTCKAIQVNDKELGKAVINALSAPK